MFSEGIERDQWHEIGSGFILAWISFSITFEGFDIVFTRQYISLLSFILFFIIIIISTCSRIFGKNIS